ncbi:MAG: PQQ-like beta-propeller repeat protein [Gemmataceae bacterium]|nr:PQQ-like beta-propeller repeat protein [Gemmataceae bacterium]
MVRTLLRWVLAVVVAVPTWLGSAAAQTWSRFRGPNGAGVVEVGKAWTEQDRLWKVRLAGKGHSSPVLWGKFVFATSGSAADGLRYTQALDRTTGTVLWTKTLAGTKHRHHDDNSWASGTPAADAQRVYVPFASPADYLIVAYEHDGREAWRVDLGPYQSGHGFGSSLLVYDGLVIVPYEHEGQSSILALDAATGAKRWQAPRRSRTTYATPCLHRPPGRPAELIAVSYEHGITALDPKTGALLWSLDVFDKGHIETSIASPVCAGELVLGCSGWLGVRKEVVAVRTSAPADKPRIAYTLTRGCPLVPTPLVRGDLLFLWDDDGIVTCADVQTGKTHWQERVDGRYYSSPICAGDRLINVSRAGEVVTLAATRQFRELGRFSLGEGSFSTPAVVERMLLVRSFHHLHAFANR